MDIDVKQVETFSRRLAQELSTLPWQDQKELLVRIGKAELKMHDAGLERPPWRGPVPRGELLGREVVVPTDQGERRGRAVCFGTMGDGSEWEATVIVHVPASGTLHEVFGSRARLADDSDVARMREEAEMARRLSETVETVRKDSSASRPTPEAPRRRSIKDPTVVPELVNIARSHPKVASVEEGGTWKVVARKGERRIYLFKSGSPRVDLSGFSVDHPACRKISDEEAKEMHLGRVRGQLLFDDRKAAVEAFKAALDLLDG